MRCSVLLDKHLGKLQAAGARGAFQFFWSREALTGSSFLYFPRICRFLVGMQQNACWTGVRDTWSWWLRLGLKEQPQSTFLVQP